MKPIGMLLVMIVTLTFSNLAAAESGALSTPKAKFSYVIGTEIGSGLQRIKDEIDLDVLLKAVNDRLKGKELLIKEDEALKIKQTEFKRIQKKHEEQGTAGAKAFLKENRKKDGVVAIASGLQYIVLEEGKGAKPKSTDKVKVHYKGTLMNGTEFDSSYKRGQPASFVLNRVIPGWTEGLQLMKTGGKYRFFIPPELGYGKRGSGRQIGPNELLIFDVELLEIEKEPAPAKK